VNLLFLAASTGVTEGPLAASEGGAAAALAIAVAFMVVAIGLFFLELLLPSFGIITLMAVGCVIAALVSAFSVSTLAGVGFVAATVALIPVLVYLAIKVAARTSLVLTDEAGSGAREGAKEDTGKTAEEIEAAAGEAGEALAPGVCGVAVTLLRPSGTASFDGRRESVVTTGEMVEAGTQIEVVRVEGIRTVVRPVRA
jgi:membrane-bound serine protease (ClpP class)